MREPKKTTKLTFAQTCMYANFCDAAGDYANPSFAKITRQLLGKKGFPKTKSGEAFKQECRKAFDMGKP
jgi:hypothetical protein